MYCCISHCLQHCARKENFHDRPILLTTWPGAWQIGFNGACASRIPKPVRPHQRARVGGVASTEKINILICGDLEWSR